MWSSSPAGKSGRAAWEQASAAQRARVVCYVDAAELPPGATSLDAARRWLSPAAPDAHLPLAAVDAAGGRTTQRASTAPSL